jgi:hypothetical protein
MMARQRPVPQVVSPERPVTDDADFILGSGSDTSVLLGGFLDLVERLACIGTAVLLFSVARRQNEAAALGFVATRLLEATIVVGVVSLFSIVTLRQDLAGGVGCSPERGTPLTSGSRTHAWTSRVLTSVGKASGWARAQARSAM